ncbi:hypothetical protein ABZ904_18020 [Streptomyces sp. NPDC046900]|uniref:hypothetical protein n=1 Tax=Streptomyces sp. NPDC046900 TaxID=3155473 RepID=UPI0033ED5FA7
MASGHFRGEGGAVFEIALPLSPAYEHKVAKGWLIQVNPDGSPFEEPADSALQESREPAATQEPPKKPNKASSKADWVAWAVHQGADQEEAESLTLAALIERFHSAE